MILGEGFRVEMKKKVAESFLSAYYSVQSLNKRTDKHCSIWKQCLGFFL